jgi:imidazolonepropionase-like amidohydrolase
MMTDPEYVLTSEGMGDEERMIKRGIPALEAIRIGTLNAAIFMGKENELDSVEEGKLTELVLLSADPFENISHTQEIDLVIKGGKVVDRSACDLPVNRR